MKDIKRPDFMKAAMQVRGHSAAIEVLIAMAVLFVGNIFVSIIQVPAMTAYLIRNKEYMRMIIQNAVDFEKVMEIMQNVPDWVMVASLLAQVGLIIVAILYCRFFEKRKANTMGFQKKGLAVQYLKGACIGAAAFLAAYGICIVTGSLHFELAPVNSTTAFYLVGFLMGYLVQGMAEEVLCRGYFLVSLARRYSISASVIISSVLFSILHSMNANVSFLAYLNLFLFGVFLALLFIRYENIWMTAAVHSIWNYFQGNLFGVQVSGMKLQPSLFATDFVEGRELVNGGKFGLEGGIAVTLVLLAGTAFVLWGMSKNGYFVQAEPVSSPYHTTGRGTANGQQPFGGWQGTPSGQGNPLNQGTPLNQGNPLDQGTPLNQGNPLDQGTPLHQGNSSDGDVKGQRMSMKGDVPVQENMGLNPEETPWYPKEETEKESSMTDFDQSYFKD